ncbi:hypothetical protein CYV15_09730 [Riemerella anatipestifer]|uniref:hypothetical protein n=1 Tax=Riemerella anatipestifer TaxID=34085 RepID=UPI00066E2E3A|nr:hypothetical protein [Riemerella anatipestifer]AKQ39430.1 hypothetical protein AS87_03645 [Riemerella anatipestifer Yb2]MDY3501709.1 hypothetical protein [Riemerella anatipestifer]PST43477.1 hypothetical protein CYV15_09730 [Riemerella anatipestifer]
MDKNNNKKHKYNQSIIKELVVAYGVTESSVRKALNGDRTSATSEAIKKDYYKAKKALEDVTKAVLNNIINQ